MERRIHSDTALKQRIRTWRAARCRIGGSAGHSYFLKKRLSSSWISNLECIWRNSRSRQCLQQNDNYLESPRKAWDLRTRELVRPSWRWTPARLAGPSREKRNGSTETSCLPISRGNCPRPRRFLHRAGCEVYVRIGVKLLTNVFTLSDRPIQSATNADRSR